MLTYADVCSHAVAPLALFLLRLLVFSFLAYTNWILYNLIRSSIEIWFIAQHVGQPVFVCVLLNLGLCLLVSSVLRLASITCIYPHT